MSERKRTKRGRGDGWLAGGKVQVLFGPSRRREQKLKKSAALCGLAD